MREKKEGKVLFFDSDPKSPFFFSFLGLNPRSAEPPVRFLAAHVLSIKRV